MADITITHTREEGTILTGSRKGDGVYEIVKDHNFRSSRHVTGLYIRGSRDKESSWRINSAATALREAGHTVTIDIDDEEKRSFAEIEAERVQRAEEREERASDRADRAASSADARRAKADQIAERFWMGQPILVGHHSEGRARRDQERIHTNMRKSFEDSDRASYWGNRAEAAAHYEKHRNDPHRTLRRLKGLRADLRSLEREREAAAERGWTFSERRERRMRELTEEIVYWEALVEEAAANGVKIWGPDDFAPGDYVRYMNSYFQVARVNPATLSIAWNLRLAPKQVMTLEDATNDGRVWTHTADYTKVQWRCPEEAMNAFLADGKVPGKKSADEASAKTPAGKVREAQAAAKKAAPKERTDPKIPKRIKVEARWDATEATVTWLNGRGHPHKNFQPVTLTAAEGTKYTESVWSKQLGAQVAQLLADAGYMHAGTGWRGGPAKGLTGAIMPAPKVKPETPAIEEPTPDTEPASPVEERPAPESAPAAEPPVEEPAIEEEPPAEEPASPVEERPAPESAPAAEPPVEEPAIEEPTPDTEPASPVEERPAPESAPAAEPPVEEPAIEEEPPAEEPASPVEERPAPESAPAAEPPVEEPAIEEPSAEEPKEWGRADFKRGDYVQALGRWHEVLRSNPRSVSVPGPEVYLIQWAMVTGRRSAAEMADAEKMALTCDFSGTTRNPMVDTRVGHSDQPNTLSTPEEPAMPATTTEATAPAPEKKAAPKRVPRAKKAAAEPKVPAKKAAAPKRAPRAKKAAAEPKVPAKKAAAPKRVPRAKKAAAEPKVPARKAAAPKAPAKKAATQKTIPIDRIDRDPNQPREHFDQAKLDELTRSMQKLGQLQPITVVYLTATKSYRIVMGERRWRAAKAAGLTEMTALVLHGIHNDPRTTLAMATAENVGRVDMTPIEEAKAFKRLEDAEYSIDEISEMVGKSPAYVGWRIDLLRLCDSAREALEKGHLTVGLSWYVSLLSANNQMRFLARHARGEFKSTREAEAFAQAAREEEKRQEEQGSFFVLAEEAPALPGRDSQDAIPGSLDLPEDERERITSERAKLTKKIDKLGDLGAILSELATANPEELALLLAGTPGGVPGHMLRIEHLREVALSATKTLRQAQAIAAVRADSIRINPEAVSEAATPEAA
ncbi:ParB/RepB/Spo0J family partition protein [Streptomyces sp. WL006]|uniref:ParB/RepB/Spo0J family partition protein n=1 Tax=Streptomyces sp. WL006 TaxID=3423915 RepID=UPI003F6BCFF6